MVHGSTYSVEKPLGINRAKSCQPQNLGIDTEFEYIFEEFTSRPNSTGALKRYRGSSDSSTLETKPVHKKVRWSFDTSENRVLTETSDDTGADMDVTNIMLDTSNTKIHEQEATEKGIFEEYFLRSEVPPQISGRRRSNSDPDIKNGKLIEPKTISPPSIKRTISEPISNFTGNTESFGFIHLNTGGMNNIPHELFINLINALKNPKAKDSLNNPIFIEELIRLTCERYISTVQDYATSESTGKIWLLKMIPDLIGLYKKGIILVNNILKELLKKNNIVTHKYNQKNSIFFHKKFINLLEVNPLISFFLTEGIILHQSSDRKNRYYDSDIKSFYLNEYERDKLYDLFIQKNPILLNLSYIGYDAKKTTYGSSTLDNMIIFPKKFTPDNILYSDVMRTLTSDKYYNTFELAMLNKIDSTHKMFRTALGKPYPKKDYNRAISRKKSEIASLKYPHNDTEGGLFTDFKLAHHDQNNLSNPFGILISINAKQKIIVCTFHLSASYWEKPLIQIIRLYATLTILENWSNEFEAQIIVTFDGNINAKTNNDAFKYLLTGKVPDGLKKELQKLYIPDNQYDRKVPLKLLFTGQFMNDYYTQYGVGKGSSSQSHRWLDYVATLPTKYEYIIFDKNKEILPYDVKSNVFPKLKITDHRWMIVAGTIQIKNIFPITTRPRIDSCDSSSTLDAFPKTMEDVIDINNITPNQLKREFQKGRRKVKGPVTFIYGHKTLKGRQRSNKQVSFIIVGECIKIDRNHLNHFNCFEIEENDIITLNIEECNESSHQNRYRAEYNSKGPEPTAVISIQKNPLTYGSNIFLTYR